MIKKIFFPREVLPIAFTISQFVNMLLSFIIIFIVILLGGRTLNPFALSFLPVIMAAEFFMALGIVYLTSAITVYFRDLEHVLSILALAWMYMTPVIYPVEYVPEKLMKLIFLNPMTSVTIGYRDILYYGNPPQMNILMNSVIMGVVFWLMGKLLFHVLQKGFVREL